MALSVAQAAGVAGRIVWGWVADRWHGGPRLTLLGLAAAMAAAGLLMPLLTAGTPSAWVILLLATYGATAIGWNGVFLGTVARLVSSGETIYREKLRFSDAQRRIEHCWQGFHDALAAEIGRLRATFGFVLLIDCHSMPRSSQSRADKADIVIGDAHGASCAPALVRLAEESLQYQGFTVRRNDPYAGGYITRHYGRPREAVHAIQIEICRSLYMDEARFQKNQRFDEIRARLRHFAAAMAGHAAAGAA